MVVGDRTGALKFWFDAQAESVLFLRPDRCIAGACIAQRAPELSADLFDALALTTSEKAVNPMAQLALCCMSHSPLLNLPGPSAELLDDINGALARAREFVADYDPELVVIFSPDHYNGFFYRLMPPFCIGTAASGVGDYGTQSGPLNVAADIANACAAAVLDAGRGRRDLGGHGGRPRHGSAVAGAVRRRRRGPGDPGLHQLRGHPAGTDPAGAARSVPQSGITLRHWTNGCW